MTSLLRHLRQPFFLFHYRGRPKPDPPPERPPPGPWTREHEAVLRMKNAERRLERLDKLRGNRVERQMQVDITF